MRLVRPAALLLTLLALGATSASAQSGIGAPTGLHAFMLRADEVPETSFARTPSFAWNPFPGADHYEFQLSLNTTFHDNSVVFADSNAPTPVEAPHVTLPWITGNPHSLYARVRAITSTGATPWSTPFGFDMVPPRPPAPLPSYPGVLRWTPVDGALGYEVWLVDTGKIEPVRTNVLDERDFYTFHSSPGWTGTVRWRVRALRTDTFNQRINGIPAVQYGAWSPIYTATNPPVVNGPITLTGTVSDTFSDGTGSAPAQSLMPAFVWSGNEGTNGLPQSLYRVYVFTDATCLNRVFTGAVVGSPAYAPRPLGPLAMPDTLKALTAAQSSILADGAEPTSYTFDGEKVAPTESEPQATPTTSVPGSPGATSPSAPSSSSSSSSSGGSSSSPAPGALTFSGNVGAPTDLWDIDWPNSGYYWTVVPVAPVLTDPTSGALQYRDLELPQDACATGRVMRFGKESQPALTSAGNVFATGLSSSGRLTSALDTTHFYGEPLVSWMPANGADSYEVQWSNTRYPFAPEQYAGANGYMTSSTSFVLPVGPGVWWYRVRGFDYSLPTGSQQMTWSIPAGITVAKPAFKIIGGGTATPAKAAKATKAPKAASTPAARMKQVSGDGFTIELPSTWQRVTAKDSLATFVYHDPARHAAVSVLSATGRSGRSYARWAADLAAELRGAKAGVVTLPGGRAATVTATLGDGKGQGLDVVEYYFDRGANALVVTFDILPSAYRSFAPTIARAIATFRVH